MCVCAHVNDGVTSWRWEECVGDGVTSAGNKAAAARHIVRRETELSVIYRIFSCSGRPHVKGEPRNFLSKNEFLCYIPCNG